MHASRLALRSFAVALLTVAGVVATSGVASANHHLMSIREVFAGTSEQPDAQYVELQMYAANQTVVNNKRIRVYDASEVLLATFTFTANVTGGAKQSTILIATAEAQTLFGVTADLTMTSAAIPLTGGKVCFNSGVFGDIDCVAWGGYVDDPSVGTDTAGTPFNGSEGLLLGSAILRDVGGGTNPAALDAADDTDDSAADFDFAAAAPRNNAGTQGAAPGGQISFQDTTFTSGEGDGTATITVTRAGGTGTVAVDYAAGDGTATGSDYGAASGTLTFPSSPQSKTFSIPVSDDGAAEGTETVVLKIRNPTGGAVLGGVPNATLSILPATLSISDTSRAEGTSTDIPLPLTVTASDPSTDPMSAAFSTSDGTARAGADYQAVVAGVVSFDPLETSAQAAVPVYADDVREADDTLQVTLADPAGATLGDATATGTLGNDDGGPLCTIEGTVGSDATLTPTAGKDVVCGLAGDDTLDGAEGNDVLIGGPGADTLTGDAGNDVLMPGPGDDPSVEGGAGMDAISYESAASGGGVSIDLSASTVTGGQGTDTVTGTENATGTRFADSLTGTTGRNTLAGLGGVDSLSGLGGLDVLKPGPGNDTLVDGGTGLDYVDYRDIAAGSVTIDLRSQATGAGGADPLTSIEDAYGTNRSDTITGTDGPNLLFGVNGDDHLFGLLGNDRLNGGNGTDECAGGGGADTFTSCETVTGPLPTGRGSIR